MNEEKNYNINKIRIRKNKSEIDKLQNRKIKYRLIQCSIAVAALISSSCSVVSYENAPADGAIIYTVGENTTEKKEGTNKMPNGPLEIVDGRFITAEGANKIYDTPVAKYLENGKRKRVDVSLYTIAAKTEKNDIIDTKKIEVEPNTYIYVQTVPTSKEMIKDLIVLAGSVVAALFSTKKLNKTIEEETMYEERLKAENRKKIRENKRIKRIIKNR